MNKKNLSMIMAVLFFNTSDAFATSTSRDQALQMMEECKVFRIQQINPLKAELINKCVNEKGKELASCQRFYNDFGETYIAANGYQQIGLFWDAPICKQALELEKYFRLYPSKKIVN